MTETPAPVDGLRTRLLEEFPPGRERLVALRTYDTFLRKSLEVFAAERLAVDPLSFNWKLIATQAYALAHVLAGKS